jgi:hypothetical protein
MTLPFTFYWAFESETTFNSSTMNVINEDIASFELKHDEGQIPTLDIVIRNPRIGLLAPGRRVWAWLAWRSPVGGAYAGALVPLFFGVLVGVPTNMFQEKVTLQFIARSSQFIARKQALAETMRTTPYYDPIFLEITKRDDPDTVLEGWSALWHIDRTSLNITASDILVGEDGTVTFDEDHAIYSSVTLKLGQAPLTNIRAEATVNWTQRAAGFFAVPTVNISSYTGDTLLGDWPKPGATIGGGYKCETSFVTDTYLVSETPTTTYNATSHNTMPNPGQCSTADMSFSSSGPALLSPNPLQCVLTSYLQSGICDPYADPPINRPATTQVTGMIVPLWNVSMEMTVRWDAKREFSEILAFDMTANVQGILTSPTVAQHTEMLTLASVDIGQPLLELDAWTDFAGQNVGLAQFIFPNNPTTPGGLAYQICVQPGIAGTVEPVFSDVPGFITVDNTVHWASIGTSPPTTASSWSPGSFVPFGQIMLLQNQVFNLNTGTFEDIPGASSYYLCTGEGYTNGDYQIKDYVPPVTSNIEPIPAIRHVSYIAQPTFSTSVGAQIGDGSVRWTVLGTSPAMMGIPIGGTADNVTARGFFHTARGIEAAEYVMSKCRARLRFRSRAVTVGWECRFDDAVALSCRKNATLFDPRLPGGAATGKVISYALSASGDGKLRGKVEIGCAIGFGDSIVEITGTPEYAAAGYAQVGYQVYDGAMHAHGSGDLTFSRPVFKGFDDGLNFPLRWDDVSDGGLISGPEVFVAPPFPTGLTLTNPLFTSFGTDTPPQPNIVVQGSGPLAIQKAIIEASFVTAEYMAFYHKWAGVSVSTSVDPSSSTSGISPGLAWALTKEDLKLISQDTPYVMNANPISWSCLLKPCAGNGPFGGSYEIQVSPLVVPQGINLEAPSSP